MSNIRTQAPYRADIVGSFLRPEELKEARKKFKYCCPVNLFHI